MTSRLTLNKISKNIETQGNHYFRIQNLRLWKPLRQESAYMMISLAIVEMYRNPENLRAHQKPNQNTKRSQNQNLEYRPKRVRKS